MNLNEIVQILVHSQVRTTEKRLGLRKQEVETMLEQSVIASKISSMIISKPKS